MVQSAVDTVLVAILLPVIIIKVFFNFIFDTAHFESTFSSIFHYIDKGMQCGGTSSNGPGGIVRSAINI